MFDDFNEMLYLMEKTFRDYEAGMPARPKLVDLSFGPAYRFET